MFRRLFSTALLLMVLLALSASTLAHAQPDQEPADSRWEGQWRAEGTLFEIRVNVTDGVMSVGEVESLGFVWTSEAGEVTGNVATIPVSYGGVSGIVQAELVDATTAVAVAASCMPEYMVVCALARNQQAVFRKIDSQN